MMFKELAVIIALTAVWSCGAKEPLSDYEPKTPQEKTLKGVLMDFQDGVNTKNAGKLGNLIHEKAALMVGRQRKILSKAEYVKILPRRLDENPPVALSKPKMMISGDKAEVRVYMTRGNYSGLMVFHMLRERDRWYINSWEF